MPPRRSACFRRASTWERGLCRKKPKKRVPAALAEAYKARLAPDASYLIVGGLGGLGRSVAHWMVDHGAKNRFIHTAAAPAMRKRQADAQRIAQERRDVAPRLSAAVCS